MALTNSQFAAQLATLLGLDSGQTSTLNDLIAAWDPTTPADLAQIVVDFVGNSTTRDTQYNNWAVGTATGGPNSDGYYPVTVLGGGTVSLPSPAKLIQQIAKGDPAKTDISFWIQGVMGPGEKVGSFKSTDTGDFDQANCQGNAGAAPTGSVVITVKKNTVTWGTATFAPGSHTPTWSLPSPASRVPGDLFELFAPASMDASIADITLTLAGV